MSDSDFDHLLRSTPEQEKANSQKLRAFTDEILALQRSSWEFQYLDLIKEILDTGDDRIDRTGVGTRAIFGKTLDINLKHGFPAVTTKKLAWKMMAKELDWFIEGSGDERRLAELMYGTRDPKKTTIWTANANADYWKPKAKFDGDLGRIYGVQWRTWNRFVKTGDPSEPLYMKIQPVDQLAEVIEKLKTNPTDRRMIVSAWNPGELDQMGLPPCHLMMQFFLKTNESGRHLSCQMYMRSSDVGLGLPFNIASYALFTHMIAAAAGCQVDRLIMNLGDVHIYSNHIEAMKEQITRTPYPPPTLQLNPDIIATDIDQLSTDDFTLINYNFHPSIKMDMAV